MPIFLILNVGIIKNVPRRISMILQIWMMIIYMKILILKLVDVLKHNLIEEIRNLQDAPCKAPSQMQSFAALSDRCRKILCCFTRKEETGVSIKSELNPY